MRQTFLRGLKRRLDIDNASVFETQAWNTTVFEAQAWNISLSPAELDASLLDLYNGAAKGLRYDTVEKKRTSSLTNSSGDVLRTLVGGGPIAFQDAYMRKQHKNNKIRMGMLPDAPITRPLSLPMVPPSSFCIRATPAFVRASPRV